MQGPDHAPGGRPSLLVAAVEFGGGVGELRLFLRALPADSGMAFVCARHPPATDGSRLSALLSGHTSMPVVEAGPETVIEANRVYVAQPGCWLAVQEGRVTSREPDGEDVGAGRGEDGEDGTEGGTVDRMLDGVARSFGERAVGVLLTGAAADGQMGLRDIRRRGGMVIVRGRPAAEERERALAAIETGVVDLVLDTEAMPRALERFAATTGEREERAREASAGQASAAEQAGGGQPAGAETSAAEPGRRAAPSLAASAAAPGEPALDQRALDHLIEVVGDAGSAAFRTYRPDMIARRVFRRMSLSGHQDFDDYLDVLSSRAEEREGLVRDLFIGVTEFFRDPEAFEALRALVVEPLVAAASPGEKLRVWAPACATGEEAYSLGMELLDAAREHGDEVALQIFATDVHEPALEQARKGLYGADVAERVGRPRLHRYFDATEDGGFRVRPLLRDVVSFGLHDVTADPPFSRMGLVSCRNLLIYLLPDVRDRVLRSLHAALDVGGYLVLGASESAGAEPEHLLTLSKEWRIYRKVGAHPPLTAPASGREPPAVQPEREPTAEAHGPGAHLPARYGHVGQRAGAAASVGDVARRAVMRVHVPPCIVVSDTGDVLFMHGELRPYLRFPDGDARLDLTSLLAPSLASRARTAVFKARREGRTVTTYSSPDPESGGQTRITASLLPEIGSGAVVLTFESPDADSAVTPAPEPESAAQAAVIDQLERELRAVQDELRGAVAELQASNEQLRVANEESTSVNEELRAANQDLEATSEELRSVNEELTSVNRQLREKVEQVEVGRDDLANFVTSTRIATLFLDEELCIKRVTPEAAMILSLVDDAEGRNLEQIEHPLLGSELVRDVRQVLRDLSDVSRELSLADGRWFNRRVLPYRTSQNRIEGAVVTLTDITAVKTATTRLGMRERQQAVIARLGLEALEDPDLQHFMDHAVREVCTTLGTDLCSVFELQPEGRVLLLRAGVGWPDGSVWHASEPAGIESHAGYAIKRDAPVVVEDLAGEHRFRPSALLRDEGARAGVSCVVRSGDVPYGALCAHTRAPHEFSPEDALFLQSVASVIAAAVARDETRARLVLKNAIAEALAEGVDLHGALIGFHESVAGQLGTVVSEFWELNEDGTALERTFVHGLDPFDDGQVEAKLPGGPVPVGEGLVGRIFARTRAEWVSSLQAQRRFYRVEEARRLGLLSGLAMPVVSGRTVRGVLTFFAQRRLYAGDALLRTLESIGRSIGDFVQYLDVEAGRKRMEEELRESEAKFRQILLNSPVPKLVYDESGAVVELSDSWTELSGYTVEELPTIGDWIREAFEGVAAADALVREVWREGGGRRHVEIDLLTKGGDVRALSANLVALGSPGRRGPRLMVMAAADVTELRRSDEERVEASRQKDEFIAMLGHELRNPLAAVRSATELLQRARPEDALIQRTQAILDRQTTHMARLLDGLLDLSRIVRGRIVLDRRLVDLGAMIRDTVRDYSVTMRDAGLDLIVDVPRDAMWIHADPVRLSQVTTNLLSNAIKFTPSPGTVTVRLTEEEGFGMLSVTDTGNGIDPELLPKLFQPFRQAQQSLDRSLGGLGLGLSLVRTLVELHDGSVEAHSEGEGLGSEFIVRLPLTHRQPAESEEGARDRPSLRILIIEDNEDAAESLREILEFEGHETAVASGGSRGIELAHKFNPDIVLCDLGLPDVNGFDVAVALREDPRTRDLYLVALSGYGRPEDKRRCREVGFDTHLTKPVLMRDLETVLSEAVAPRPRWSRRRASRAESASSGASAD